MPTVRRSPSWVQRSALSRFIPLWLGANSLARPEQGMAGNVDCAASPPADPVHAQPPAAAPPATSDSAQLSPVERQYVNDLAEIGIQPN